MAETLMQRVRRIRKERKLTIFELAVRIRIPEATISSLEKGNTTLTAQQADVIRAFLAGKL